MSLSRLSARSNAHKLRVSNSVPANEPTYSSLWQAIQRTRLELDRWQQQSSLIDELFRIHIMPKEQQLTIAAQTITESLIQHFEHTALTTGEKSLLGLWINENLEALQDHPFAENSRTAQLNDSWLLLINHPGSAEIQLARLASNTLLKVSAETDVHKGFAGPENRQYNDDTNAPDDTPDHRDSHNSQESQVSNDSQDSDCSVGTNNAKLSIERLFRQLAKVLHPDREQDESAKVLKHQLMSQCLQARNDNDIDTLLQLYCEHVGDLPEGIDHAGHEELITQMKAQLSNLQNKLHDLRYGNTLLNLIVDRYHTHSVSETESRVDNHARSLEHELESLSELERQLDSIDGLKAALSHRRLIAQDQLDIDELTGLSTY